jgi:hypothetical protein
MLHLSNEIQAKKYHIVPKSNKEIVEKEAKLISLTHIHD